MNSWMNWLYLFYISGCISSRKMRLPNHIFACWYESLMDLASSLKGSFTTNLPLSCIRWYLWSDHRTSVRLMFNVLLSEFLRFSKIAVNFLVQNIWRKTEKLSRPITSQPKQGRRKLNWFLSLHYSVVSKHQLFIVSCSKYQVYRGWLIDVWVHKSEVMKLSNHWHLHDARADCWPILIRPLLWWNLLMLCSYWLPELRVQRLGHRFFFFFQSKVLYSILLVEVSLGSWV